eukprot:TRINITY_DN761_c0_g1_i1.p1 TRINITY_DN761_c0_g1~~TRINITY_DN761_c0_g1_i1.p1  ORF type:complete len:610 (+),score=83.85 TRINITY_DN761_c0_g1_i1:203-2032(+)
MDGENIVHSSGETNQKNGRKSPSRVGFQVRKNVSTSSIPLPMTSALSNNELPAPIARRRPSLSNQQHFQPTETEATNNCRPKSPISSHFYKNFNDLKLLRRSSYTIGEKSSNSPSIRSSPRSSIESNGSLEAIECPSSEHICEDLLNGNFESLRELSTKLFTTQITELIENVIPFLLSSSGSLYSLQQWAVKDEISTIKRLPLLFRSDNLNRAIVTRAFSGELSRKWVNYIAHPVFQRVQANPQMEPSEHLEMCSILLERMEESEWKCPLYLRQLFRAVQLQTEEKFPHEMNNQGPFGLSFMIFNFMVPVLVNPEQHGLLQGTTPDISRCMFQISKILKDVGVRSSRPESNIEYTESKYPKLLEFFKKIVDLESIQTAQMIIECSVETTSKGKFDKFAITARNNLSRFIESCFLDSRSSSPTLMDNESPQVFEMVQKEFVGMIDSLFWKYYKTIGDFFVHKLKFPEMNSSSLCISYTVCAPLEETWQYYLNEVGFGIPKSSGVDEHNVTFQKGNYLEREWTTTPNNRMFSVSEWSVMGEGKSTQIRMGQRNKKKNGSVITFIPMSGDEFSISPHNPKHTQVRHLVHPELKFGTVRSFLVGLKMCFSHFI